MAIIAGIDEAGYGPVLGPLVVSGVAFRLPDDRVDACLWNLLRHSCARRARRNERRLAVADSKDLYRSGGIAALERAVLVMLAVRGLRPRTLKALLDATAPGACERLAAYAWYADTELELPVSENSAAIGPKANAVRLDCTEQGIQPLGAFCEPLPEGHYNRLVGNIQNKGVLLLGQTLRVIDRIMREVPGERVRIYVDRLGGRKHYRDALLTALPGYELQILEESPLRSEYRLVRSQRVCEIQFTTRGDALHFPVALASLFSKYLRELLMHLFNEYWSARQRGLRPTAGYYTDAQRWLGEAASTLDRLGVDREMLVRQR